MILYDLFKVLPSDTNCVLYEKGNSTTTLYTGYLADAPSKYLYCIVYEITIISYTALSIGIVER